MGRTLRRVAVALAAGARRWPAAVMTTERDGGAAGRAGARRSPSSSPATPRSRASTATWSRAYKARRARGRDRRGRRPRGAYAEAHDLVFRRLAPDASWSTTATTARFAAPRRARPGRSEAGRPRRSQREQFYPKPLEAFTFDGELQCMPQNASSLVVYYNKDSSRRSGSEPAAGLELRRVHGGRAGADGGAGRARDRAERDPRRPVRLVGGRRARRRPGRARPSSRSTGRRRRRGLEACSLSARRAGAERRGGRGQAARRALPRRRARDVHVLAPRGPGVAHDRPTSSGTSRRSRPTSRRPACCTATASASRRARNADAAWEFIEFALGPEGQQVSRPRRAHACRR